MEMPSKKQYDLVSDEGLDMAAQSANDAMFRTGLNFHAKYIASREVQRPTSRVEIVAAMRRIRYECKVKSIKKTKVNITVSVDGVTVAYSKPGRRKRHSAEHDDPELVIHRHPIFRIFYVSHDSQDLLIFSYIARDESHDAFQCSVFKAYKKNQAVDIVRTIGQAFEVCHRLGLQLTSNRNDAKTDAEVAEYEKQHATTLDRMQLNSAELPVNSPKSPQPFISSFNDNASFAMSLKNTHVDCQSLAQSDATSHADSLMTYSRVNRLQHPLSIADHDFRLLREQLALQGEQMQFLKAETKLLNDRLAAETSARVSAQARTRELMMQNRELIDHIDILVGRLAELEAAGGSLETAGVQHLTRLPSVSSQANSFVDPSSPAVQNGSVLYLEPTLPKAPGSVLMPPTQLGKTSLSKPSLHAVDYCNGSMSEPPCPETSASDDGETLLKSASFERGDNIDVAKHLMITDNGNRSYRPPAAIRPGVMDKTPLIIVPSPLQDATGNRLELGLPVLPPRLRPPPKLNRISDRPLTADVAAHCLSGQRGTGKEKRYSWGCYMPMNGSGRITEDHEKSGNTLPKPSSLDQGMMLNCSAYTIKGSTSDTTLSNNETSVATISTVTECLNEVSACEDDSVESRSELKLSFSDDECFVDTPSKQSSV